MFLKLITDHVNSFVSEHEIENLAPFINTNHELLNNKTGPGNNYLGWLDIAKKINSKTLESITNAANKIKSDSDILIVIGIGGSYLGARAVIEMIKSPLYNSINKKNPDIYFAGTNISSSYLSSLLEICKDKDVSINVISKSGSTIEPGIAFRVFREFLEKKYGKEESKSRIYVTTDEHKGKLKELANHNNYQTFPIPDDVGGRFSVLTAVGLLPIAVAGIDIYELLNGAKAAMYDYNNPSVLKNDCYKYAALRNCLYRKNKLIELLVCYEPGLNVFCEWFKQLFGESEGKDQKGIFPSSVSFSTDLHSLGQYIQDGSRILFETVLDIKSTSKDLIIQPEDNDFDGLNFIANKPMSFVNRCALEGTVAAHTKGGVPNIILEIPEINEFNTGYLIFFFEKACAMSGYLLGVNPFDQPGVEFYKKNMFSLLES
ncbi:MAG: glucose-6-phosphate isomerase [Oscillospiraceae bacterium]|nr:glucose-6-phosphate isomerase [Oscillospiraceae bacterium]